MNSIKPKSKSRPLSTKTEDQQQNTVKTTKTSRKGQREARGYSFNKPIRNIKFLEISRVNSILPDKYQLGLQPIKKKEMAVELGNKPLLVSTRVGIECQTDPRA